MVRSLASLALLAVVGPKPLRSRAQAACRLASSCHTSLFTPYRCVREDFAQHGLSRDCQPLIAAETDRSSIIQPPDQSRRCPILSRVAQGGRIEVGAPTGKWQLVVVYRGKHCPVSKNYLASLQQIIYELDELGVEVVAVSGDGRERAEAFVSLALSKHSKHLSTLANGHSQQLVLAQGSASQNHTICFTC